MTLFLSLFGCYDFQGDDNVLWFTSDLALDGKTAWTPEHAVAGGLAPTFGATALVGDEEAGQAPVVWGAADSSYATDEPNLLKLGPMTRGSTDVWFEGEAEDSFSVRFRPASEVVVVDAVGRTLDDIALAPNTEVALRVRVQDRWGRDLGWHTESLQVEADETLSAWPVNGLAHVDGAGGLFLTAGDVDGFVSIRQLEPVRSEVRFVAQLDDVCVFEHVAWSEDGTRVLGVPAAFDEELEAIGGDLAVSDVRGRLGCE
ncbi:MAG: hypothetical protein GY913_12855 [Proteobacteria bacterium]|nr:hypothetical protein [Pseudomonadota bacterium]MCP4917796.1 hypothetical protein [Pseudomonadota bacterium]